MGLKHLQLVVLMVVALVAFQYILAYHFQDAGLDRIDWDEPVLKNLTTTLRAVNSSTDAFFDTAYIAANGTVIAPLNSANDSLFAFFYPDPKPEKSFWFNTLPKDLLLYALALPVSYFWNVYLERWFPARKSASTSALEKRSEKADVVAGEDGNDWEQKVVDRWLAQGKVSRSSISIWRTLLKWVLDLTVGNVLFQVVFHVFESLIFNRRISKLKADVLGKTLSGLLRSFPSVGPFITLVGFILVPAKNRLVFLHAGLVIQSLFMFAFLITAVSPILRSGFAKAIMEHQAETLWQNAAINAMGPDARIPVRQHDEL